MGQAPSRLLRFAPRYSTRSAGAGAKSTSNRRRLRPSCVRISPIWFSRLTCPPVAYSTYGNGVNPGGDNPRWRISSGDIAARASHVTPAESLTRTPPCTGLRPARHSDTRDRIVRQIAALVEKRLPIAHDLWLLGLAENRRCGLRRRHKPLSNLGSVGCTAEVLRACSNGTGSQSSALHWC
jgi:hypothetical protein